MSHPPASSNPVRRDRTGGVVRDRLDLLMAELAREQVPQRLLDLAQDLQLALDEKISKET
ncbi:hypothetical protein [Rhizobium glycinendophyticum]|uniref:Anti-sigma factor NepR domain-containing protein n=1 Tax=Rhizobium glycinendophyticum TaxID=2589807 RepID=A0A504U0M0_9HYPH|nr:hypothetical protein [Rhizobium glycinendophyticum]TPP07037.1 hypothetical protein FJQ55_15360 [Rhizobium glycinendophyticum]